MSTIVELVRHGETEWNILGKFQGSHDIELSKEGILQAQYLSRRYEGDFDCIYSSPLKRSLETAKVISAPKNIKPIINSGLREINFGEWEGLTRKEIESRYPENYFTWRNDEFEAPLCGGDLSIRNASKRAKDTILEIVRENKEKRTIIVTHGGLIKAALVGLFNWKMTMYHNIFLGNTSVCKLVFSDNTKPVILCLNDTSHLPSDYNIRSYV